MCADSPPVNEKVYDLMIHMYCNGGRLKCLIDTGCRKIIVFIKCADRLGANLISYSEIIFLRNDELALLVLVLVLL